MESIFSSCCCWSLPWQLQRRDEDVVQGGEARGELGSLGAEDGVLGVDGEEALGGEAERSDDVRILAAEVCHLRGEVVERWLCFRIRDRRADSLFNSILFARRCSISALSSSSTAVDDPPPPPATNTALPLLPLEEAINNQPIDGEVDSHGIAARRSQPNRSRHPSAPAAAHLLPMHAP
ncbi:Os06g0626900 [Oryza sativa Japonica Group]|uniref:Uncharacterized protein n=2 Tax=Oryza sativa subsp. japonica TaxID=39947 RepID=A0A0P0WYX2_ORYSJ|nr:hypothetical protein [Oryza sativa Japonica Group]BAD37756.1 hypothetical protein [Oryza sativa Japonica Group]BAS98708.1 Os06g0626900 [Oryza sativa Japonica Group]